MTDGKQLLDKLAPTVREVLELTGRLAEERGDRAYLVGGRVRDLILDRSSEDVDVVVVGDGMAVAQALSRAEKGALTRHHAFRTATVELPHTGRIDVATARSEVYERPGLLPLVKRGDLHADLARRDFTINTLALSLWPDALGELIDPFDGRDDIDNGVVRILHERSFADDPTRMLRALRFANRFGYRLDDLTERAFATAIEGGYLDTLSGRRLCRELIKLFGESPVEGALLLAARQVLPALHDGLEADREALERLRAQQEELVPALTRQDAAVGPVWARVMALLARPMLPQARWELINRLRMSQSERRPLLDSGAPWQAAHEALGATSGSLVAGQVADLLDPLSVDGLLVGLATLSDAEAEATTAVRRYLQAWRWVRAELNGDELIALGCERGPQVGELMRRLRRARLDGEVEDAEQERQAIRRWLRPN